MDEIDRIVAIRDHLKKRSHRIFIEDSQHFRGLLESDQSLTPIFQSLFADVAPIKINLHDSETINSPRDASLDLWNDNEFDGAKIWEIAYETGFVFVNCNYFRINTTVKDDRRVFAPNLMRGWEENGVSESMGELAFRTLQAIRSVFEARELLPIVDFITQAAPIKRAFAVVFVDAPLGESFYGWEPDVSVIRETKGPCLKIYLEGAFQDFLNNIKDELDQIKVCASEARGARECSNCIALLKFKIARWIDDSNNVTYINDRLRPVAEILGNWYQLPNTFEPTNRRSLSNMESRDRSDLQLPEDVCGMDVFSILVSLLPLKELLGVKCHYSYPCEIRSSADNRAEDISCAVLTFGTKTEIKLPGRKMLSDLTSRVMLIPLAEQLVWKQEADAIFNGAFGGYLPNQVLKIFKRESLKKNQESLLDAGVSGPGTFVFADISGYSKFTATWLKFNQGPQPTPLILRLLRVVWNAIGQKATEYGGVIGKHAGDGAFIFFPGVAPFQKIYIETDHTLRAFCFLSRLPKLFEAAKSEWMHGDPEVKGYFRSFDKTQQIVDPDDPSRIRTLPADVWLDTQINDMNLHVGMHVGTATFGNIVEGLSYTAIGHDVNECARLQEIADDWEVAMFGSDWHQLEYAADSADLPIEVKKMFKSPPSRGMSFRSRYESKNPGARLSEKLAYLRDRNTFVVTNEYLNNPEVTELAQVISGRLPHY